MQKRLRHSLWALAIIFIIIIAGYTAVFFAIRFGWTKVQGEIDPNSSLYNQSLDSVMQETSELDPPRTLPTSESIYGSNEIANRCRLSVAGDLAEKNAVAIYEAYVATRSDLLLERMLLALSFRIPDRRAFVTRLEACKGASTAPSFTTLSERFNKAQGTNLYVWQNYEPWSIIRGALAKDMPVIERAGAEVGVQPRLIVSVAIVEQLRLFYTQRELFEKIFKPLNILASANKMAWGILSIKEAAAISAERHLKDPSSPYYLGPEKEHLLDFPAGVNISSERYRRLTNERDHYYSYLYGAVIIKQLEKQWELAGHPIAYRPEVIATLFNLGFDKSKPKAAPEVGGSTITIEGRKYFFGSLAYEFYYSGELMDSFPYK